MLDAEVAILLDLQSERDKTRSRFLKANEDVFFAEDEIAKQLATLLAIEILEAHDAEDTFYVVITNQEYIQIETTWLDFSNSSVTLEIQLDGEADLRRFTNKEYSTTRLGAVLNYIRLHQDVQALLADSRVRELL